MVIGCWAPDKGIIGWRLYAAAFSPRFDLYFIYLSCKIKHNTENSTKQSFL
jgi:hypothetical protein